MRRSATVFRYGIQLGLMLLTMTSEVSAGIIQWRNRVPTTDANPSSIGSHTSTIEISNGGTVDYDAGLDVELDTSIVPGDAFFVTYVDQHPRKVEYEFTHELQPGESYTALLSFENRLGDFYFTPNTVEFLAVNGNFAYDLAVDTNDNGSYDTFRSGSVLIGELAPWNQGLFPGNDHRNGWYYGELTITNAAPEPTCIVYAGIGLGILGATARLRRRQNA